MPSAPKTIGDPLISQRGSSVLMVCVIEADPAPTEVKWFKDDKEISEDGTYVFKKSPGQANKFEHSCEIKNFDKPHGGTYKCTVGNGVGSVSNTFSVSTGDAPEMPEKPKIVTKKSGDGLKIKVSAKSKHEPTASWTADDKPLKEGDKFKFHVEQDKKDPTKYLFILEITNPAKEDQAKYCCTVKNKEGSNSQSLDLAFD